MLVLVISADILQELEMLQVRRTLSQVDKENGEDARYVAIDEVMDLLLPVEVL